MGNRIGALFLLAGLAAAGQTVPDGWKVVQDGKRACQIAVPPEWTILEGSAGADVFRDATTAIAVVTSQPGQEFKPLPESLRKLFGSRGEKLIENSARRILCKDKTSRHADDPSAYSISVPGKGGTCSCRVLFLPAISEDQVKQIAFSLGPATE